MSIIRVVEVRRHVPETGSRVGGAVLNQTVHASRLGHEAGSTKVIGLLLSWLLLSTAGSAGDSASIAAEARNAFETRISEILILPHCHADFAYGHPREWHEKRYNLALNEALDLMKTDPSFRYMFDSYWDFLHPFLELSPTRVRELRKRVRENRIGIHGGQLANAKPDHIGGELYIRNLILGKRIFKELFPGKEIEVASTFDNCYGYTQIPQLIKLAGYRYWWFSRVHDPFKAGVEMWKDGIPREFIFKGLDGTEVIASRVGYSGLNSDIVPAAMTAWDDKVAYFWTRQYAPGNIIKDLIDQSRAGILAIPQGTDDSRPLRRRTTSISYGHYDVLADPGETYMGIQKFLKEWQKRERVPMRFATPEEYFSKVAAGRSRLPVVGAGILKWADRGDPGNGLLGSKDFQWWWGRSEATLLSLEKADALLRLAGGSPVLSGKALDELWFDLASTTGHAHWCVFSGDFEREFARITGVQRRADACLHRALTALARLAPSDKAKGIPLAVFNLSNWERTDQAEIAIDLPPRLMRNADLTDGTKRLSCESEVVRRHRDGSIARIHLAFTTRIPALSYKMHYLRSARQAPAQPATVPLTRSFTFTNQWYTAAISPHGRWQSLVEKSSNTALIKGTGADHLYFNLPRERTFPVYFELSGQRIDPVYESGFIREGPTKAEVILEMAVRIRGKEDRLVERITFYGDSPAIDLDISITTHGGYGGAYLIDLPLALAAAAPTRVAADTPFGVEDKTGVDTFWARHWVDVSNGEAGLAVINEPGRGKYRLVGDTAHRGVLLRHPLLPCIDTGSSKLYRDRSPAWSGSGTHAFKLRLYPHASDWRDAKVWRIGQAAANPFAVVQAEPEASKSSASHSRSEQDRLVDIGPANIVLSAARSDSNHLYLRFYETTGARSRFKINLNKRFKTAWKTDLLDHKLHASTPVRIVPSGSGCTIEGAVRPWEIVSLAVQR